MTQHENSDQKSEAGKWAMQILQAMMLAAILGGGGWFSSQLWGAVAEVRTLGNDVKNRLIVLETSSAIRGQILDRLELNWQTEARRLDLLESEMKRGKP